MLCFSTASPRSSALSSQTVIYNVKYNSRKYKKGRVWNSEVCKSVTSSPTPVCAVRSLGDVFVPQPGAGEFMGISATNACALTFAAGHVHAHES